MELAENPAQPACDLLLGVEKADHVGLAKAGRAQPVHRQQQRVEVGGEVGGLGPMSHRAAISGGERRREAHLGFQ
jgi:hypothetical protein